jgi:tetratricopeptide (TPR) repeat protein
MKKGKLSCSTARKWISESVDGNLSPERVEFLDAHVRGCEPCRKLKDAFAAIREGAGTLEEQSPSENVWNRIQRSMTTDRIAEQSPRPRKAWSLSVNPRLRPALVSAFALVLILAAVFIGLRQFGIQPATTGLDPSQQFALDKLKEAEGHYRKAIEALSAAVSAREADFDPQILAVFQKNLTVVNQSIEAYRQAVLNDPQNFDTRSYLLTAYQEKTDLLNEIMALNDRSAQTRKTGTTI